MIESVLRAMRNPPAENKSDLVIWCVMRDFLQFSHESRHIPFPSLVTSLVEAARMRGAAKEKRVIPRLGPITNKTRPKAEPHLRDPSLHSLQ